jgi:predicted O-methyltransferase YrrM
MPMTTESATTTREGGLGGRATVPRWGLWLLSLTLAAALTVSALYAWRYQRRAARSASQYANLRQAAFKSPLPKAEVALAKPAPGQSALRGNYEFTQDWFSKAIPVWTTVLEPYKGRPGVNYLEVGLYEGRSAVWMLENILTDPTSRLTGLDVFSGTVKERCLKNLERTGAAGRTTTIIEPSQVSLRKLPLESFDVIYIDGSHATSDVLEDAVLSYRLLKPGGLLIFDDYRWAGADYVAPALGTNDQPADLPKAAIDAFCQCFDQHIEIVYNTESGEQLVVRKKAGAH